MKRIFCCVSALIINTLFSTGCTGEAGPLPDLPGKAPELAGSWAEPDPQSSTGCLIVDETGDLVAIRGRSVGEFEGAPTELILDGQWRTLTVEGNSIEYAAVGEATLEGSTARLRFEITVRSAGANIVTFSTIVEGPYDGTRIAGTVTATAVSHVPGLPPPPAPEVGDVELVLSDC